MLDERVRCLSCNFVGYMAINQNLPCPKCGNWYAVYADLTKHEVSEIKNQWKQCKEK